MSGKERRQVEYNEEQVVVPIKACWKIWGWNSRSECDLEEDKTKRMDIYMYKYIPNLAVGIKKRELCTKYACRAALRVWMQSDDLV